jgi:predicted SnoaL-like aldol condensation-catalyzing enzyme
MKKYLTGALLVLGTTVVLANNTTKNEGNNMLSKKEKVVAVLNSIQTPNNEVIKYINKNKYTQHNLSVEDGLAGFGKVLGLLPKNSAKVDVIRAYEDENFVFTHTKYNFFGPKAGFDIFRFEDGKIVEHWDNLEEIVNKTASGRTQFDGDTKSIDLEKTSENKQFIKDFISDILMGENPNKITEYISSKKYLQHNPYVKDGLSGLGEAIEALNNAGTPMVYKKNHMILGEGNFVLSVSEGIFMKEHVSFYDLFRIENKKIVEHWDTIEKIPSKDKLQNSNGKF